MASFINIVPCPLIQDVDDYWLVDQPSFVPVIPHNVNVVTNWSGTDNEENFKRNPKPGYTADSIVYKYNSHGYRTQEFDTVKPSMLCLGCSFTEGVGVNIQDTWSAHLQERFSEHNVYNLGIGGCSGDTVTRTLYSIGNMLNIDTVFILWPHFYRYEVYNPGAPIAMFPGNDQGYTPGILTDTHFYNLRQKNRAIVALLKQLHGYNVIEEYVDTVWHTGRPGAGADNGRDNHPGPIWHKHIANLLLEKYDNSKI